MSALRKHSIAALGDETFARFQKLALATTGIVLDGGKRAMIFTRFARRLRALDLPDFDTYLELVAQSGHPERAEFIDTVTTNLTYFFREPHHFELLASRILPSMAADRTGRGRPIRIWSAGCSYGQEPYSIAMAVLESRAPHSCPVRILCTDIHSGALRRTATGVYRDEELRGLDDERRERWFAPSPGGGWRARDELREMLVCKELNLFGPWPVRPGVDVVFCRNVLIYFDAAAQQRLIRGFAAIQSPGSHLMLGHSETLRGCESLYHRVAITTHKRR